MVRQSHSVSPCSRRMPFPPNTFEACHVQGVTDSSLFKCRSTSNRRRHIGQGIALGTLLLMSTSQKAHAVARIWRGTQVTPLVATKARDVIASRVLIDVAETARTGLGHFGNGLPGLSVISQPLASADVKGRARLSAMPGNVVNGALTSVTGMAPEHLGFAR